MITLDPVAVTAAVLFSLWAICSLLTAIGYVRFQRAGFPESWHWRLVAVLLPTCALVSVSLAAMLEGSYWGLGLFIGALLVGYLFHFYFRIRWWQHRCLERARQRSVQPPFVSE